MHAEDNLGNVALLHGVDNPCDGVYIEAFDGGERCVGPGGSLSGKFEGMFAYGF